MKNEIGVAERKLVAIVRKLADEKRSMLEEMKKENAQLSRSDFVWHYLLQSFSTWGNSRGWDGLMGTPRNYDRVAFDTLFKLDPFRRAEQILETFRDAKIRMPDKKAAMASKCFALIQSYGGAEEAREALLSQPGREGKIRFLERFEWIGPKYARNIMMDVYHEDFRDSIAIDERVKKVTEALGRHFDTYEEHERFYLGIAEQAGLNGWELDRIMYGSLEEVIWAVMA